MTWTPHVTVAAIVERDGRFLVVEEETDAGIRFNQPAGHLEEHETLLNAVARETLEETGWHFRATGLLGIYRWRSAQSGITYLRFAFTGELGHHEFNRPLDKGIVRALWLTPMEIAALEPQHRSPQVQRCLDDYLGGQRYPLDLLKEYGD